MNYKETGGKNINKKAAKDTTTDNDDDNEQYWVGTPGVYRKGLLATLSFLTRTLVFVLWGFLVGKGTGGLHNGNYKDDVTIGLESITTSKKKTKKKILEWFGLAGWDNEKCTNVVVFR